MSFFKKLFTKDKPSQRQALQHPRDLQLNDIIKFNFLDQADLSNKQFEVAVINTYDFQGDHATSFTLQGEGGERFWLSVMNDDSQEQIAISKKLSRKDVTALFDTDAFAEIFEEGPGTEIRRIKQLDAYEHWVAEQYIEVEDCAKGYFLQGDYRNKPLPKYEGDGESLDYYQLTDATEKYAIEIEVYDGGETEVMATLYLDLDEIAEMWPA